MKRSRRNGVIGVLVDLVVRVGAGGGFLLGALLGFQGRPRAVGCSAGQVCVGDQFSSAVWAVFGPAAAGAAAGLLASLVVVLMLRRFRHRPARPPRVPGR